MLTRTLISRRPGRRPRPSRFPMPGFPRGAPGHRVPVPTARVRAAARPGRAGSRAPLLGEDLAAAAATGAGIVFWGGLLVLLA